MQRNEFLNCFASYPDMAKVLKTYDCREILVETASMAGSDPVTMENYSAGCFQGAPGSTYGLSLQELQKNIAQYDWLYERLEDDDSRLVLANLIGYRMFPARSFLEGACGVEHAQSLEGEKTACDGACSLLEKKGHIRDEFPELVLNIRWLSDELWEMPRLLDSIRSGYRLFLFARPSGSDWKVVCYAIPSQKEHKKGGTDKKIVAMSIGDGWSDAQLIKDCGVIPYLLSKNHFCEAYMAGAKLGEYPNLKFLPGLKMEFLPESTLQSKLDYLAGEAGDIDGLLLYGAYAEYAPLADLYKQLNPNGKIYLALDANSFWMDRIQWTAPNFSRLLGQCDVIGASGRTMQRHLNEKWPWVIEYLPNGFYNFAGTDMAFAYEKKGNVIFTAGRLGNYDKATHVLLEAFASIADEIPDWSLRLAGTIEEAWETGYLSRFWEQHPSLKERICFLGHISDKETLYQEYLSAKIFALTSRKEGGCPNVIAEALSAGDAIAITKIDEYRDAIDNGRCGLAADRGDVDGVANILLQLCRNENLEQLCCRAWEYARENFDMEKIVDKLCYLLFGEE